MANQSSRIVQSSNSNNNNKNSIQVHSCAASRDRGLITDTAHTHITFLNAELSPICHLLALLGAHNILHVSGVRVKTEKSATYYTRKIKHRTLRRSDE
jgi:hypothetical protein